MVRLVPFLFIFTFLLGKWIPVIVGVRIAIGSFLPPIGMAIRYVIIVRPIIVLQKGVSPSESFFSICSEVISPPSTQAVSQEGLVQGEVAADIHTTVAPSELTPVSDPPLLSRPR